LLIKDSIVKFDVVVILPKSCSNRVTSLFVFWPWMSDKCVLSGSITLSSTYRL